jgi:hypothetical protein
MDLTLPLVLLSITIWIRYCNVSYALGRHSDHRKNGKIVDGEKDKWKPNWNAVKAKIEFAKATGRLQTQT